MEALADQGVGEGLGAGHHAVHFAQFGQTQRGLGAAALGQRVVLGADEAEPVAPEFDHLQLLHRVGRQGDDGHFQGAIHHALIGKLGIQEVQVEGHFRVVLGVELEQRR